METEDMETMEITEKRQEAEKKNVNKKDEGYRALVMFNRHVGQFFGPDPRGDNN